MSTFADFALLAAVPAYGGAEILRAQRILPMGPGPRVHLTVLGRNDSVTRRVVAAAHAGSAVLHPALSRIFEVCRFDGVAYAVSDPSEGLDLSALIARSKRPLPYELSLAIVASLARVAVGLHDVGGPGSRGGPAGFASVVSGGLCPEVLFLEPTGAVRLRPVSAAGIDPDRPSALRAPEEAISAAADVYNLGRLLIVMLSGDTSGLTMPRLSPTSTLATLIGQMVQRRPEQRPPLHDVVTRLESALRERNVGSADQAVRAALQGPFKAWVVDPGLGFDAPPHIAHELRMRLPYVYAAIERLWPSMNPSFAPAPAVFAALPPPQVSSPAAGAVPELDDDDDVFNDAPRKRSRPKTAATLLIDANELAAQVAAVDAIRPPEEANRRRGRGTVKTTLIPVGEMVRELDDFPDLPADDDDSARAAMTPVKTVIIEGPQRSPFAPAAPGRPGAFAAPIPADDAFADDPDAATRELSIDSIDEAGVLPRVRQRDTLDRRDLGDMASDDVFGGVPDSPEQRPARPPTLAALAVFDNGDADSNLDGAVVANDFGTNEGSLIHRLQAAEDAANLQNAARALDETRRRVAPTIDAPASARDLLRSMLDDDDLDDEEADEPAPSRPPIDDRSSVDDGAIDASEEGEAGFLSNRRGGEQSASAMMVGEAPVVDAADLDDEQRTDMRVAVTTSAATVAERLPQAPTPSPVAPKPPPPPPVAELPFSVSSSPPLLSEDGDFAMAFAAAFAGANVASPVAATRADDNVDDDAADDVNARAHGDEASDEQELLDADDLEEIEEVDPIDDADLEVIEAIDDDDDDDEATSAPPPGPATFDAAVDDGVAVDDEAAVDDPDLAPTTRVPPSAPLPRIVSSVAPPPPASFTSSAPLPPMPPSLLASSLSVPPPPSALASLPTPPRAPVSDDALRTVRIGVDQPLPPLPVAPPASVLTKLPPLAPHTDDAMATVRVDADTPPPSPGPHDQSTRLFAAQAMQRALDDDASSEADADDGALAFRDGDLEADIDAALDGALGDSPWAPAGSTPPTPVNAADDDDGPRTELVEGWRGSAIPELPTPPPSFAPLPAPPIAPAMTRGPAPVSAPSMPLPLPPTSSPTNRSDDRSAPRRSAPQQAVPSPPSATHLADERSAPRRSSPSQPMPTAPASPSIPAPVSSPQRPLPSPPATSTAPRTKPAAPTQPWVSPFAALSPSSPSSPATMVSPPPSAPPSPSAEGPATTASAGPDADPFSGAVPRNITGLFAPPSTTGAVLGGAMSELVVEAPHGAAVALNGAAVGVVADDGRFAVEVASDARVVVRVTFAGHAPWSSVVTVKGRPRVRVKAALQPR